jgi:hypothetical protein
MKLIYVTLIAVGTGITGFVAGGGLGLWGGATVGGLAGGLVGGATGACMTVDAATTLGIITPDQAEKIGIQLAQDLKVKGTKFDNFSVQGTTKSCNRMVQGIVQAGK